MAVRVRVASGSGFDLLMAAAAVADPDWRTVFDAGQQSWESARRAGGSALLRDAARFGRFGWINLASLLVGERGAVSSARLRELVERTTPDELHLLLIGGRRRELATALDAAVLRDAAAGQTAAVRAVRAAVDAEGSLSQVAPWLLRTHSEEVHGACRRVLDALPEPPSDDDAARRLRTALRSATAENVLAVVAPGVRYGSDALHQVVLVPTVHVAPVIVVIDEVRRSLILHPPLGPDGEESTHVDLGRLGKAMGDTTRMAILAELRPGPRRLAELCTALDSPRTTLLHHLALLRAAGLIEITVPAAGPNVYTVSSQGFERLAVLARDFLRSS